MKGRITETQLRQIIREEIADKNLQLEGHRAFAPNDARQVSRYMMDRFDYEEAIDLYNRSMDGESSAINRIMDVAREVAENIGHRLPILDRDSNLYVVGEILRGLAYQLRVPFKRSKLIPAYRPAWKTI